MTAVLPPRIRDLLGRQPAHTTLLREFYSDAEVFEQDLGRIW